MAIRKANSDPGDQIDYEELKKCMFNLNYLPALSRFESPETNKDTMRRSQQTAVELEEENELL